MKPPECRLRFLSVGGVVLTLLLSASSALAQTTNSTRGRIGLGTSITDVGEFIVLSSASPPPSVIAPTILLPIDITPRFRVEPEVGYYRNSATGTAEFGSLSQTSTNTLVHLHVGAGAFGLSSTDRFTIYYGARVAYLRSTQSSTSSSGSTASATAPGVLVAPALGGEFFLWDRLSLGAEVQVRFTTSKTTTAQVPSATSTATTVTTTSTRGAILLRFYFPT
jgi:outer membrane protein with beta-barrel domain